MKVLSKVILRGACIGVLGTVLAYAQAPAAKPLMAEDVFKNVQVLKGIPVDEFMSTMGIFSAALGISCENCHSLSDKSWADYALDATPKKRTARRMVTHDAGHQQAIFWRTAGDHLFRLPSRRRSSAADAGSRSDLWCDAGRHELDDATVARREGSAACRPDPRKIYRCNRRRSGRWLALTTIVAKGMSSGYGPESRPRGYELYLKAPGLREQIVHTDSGDSIITTDGKTAWISAPFASGGRSGIYGRRTRRARSSTQ